MYYSSSTFSVVLRCKDLNHVKRKILLTLWESHDRKYSIQLIVVVGGSCFDILLTTMEDWFSSKQFGKDAANCPDICQRNKTKYTLDPGIHFLIKTVNKRL